MRHVPSVLLLALLCGCGAGDSEESAPSHSDDPFPLQVGNRWTLETLNSPQGGRSQTTHQVVSAEPSPGGMRFTTSESNVYERTSSEIRMLPGTRPSPKTAAIGPVTFLKLPLRLGDSWTQFDLTGRWYDHDGDGALDLENARAIVTVLRSEQIQTPAGTFPNATLVRVYEESVAYASSSPSYTYSFSKTSFAWYAPGVGLVRRETSAISSTGISARQTIETLQSYSVN